jgi:hypothetical protein
MKRVIKISAIILLYFLGCGKSCVDDTERTRRQEMEVKTEIDSIRAAFEVSSLSAEAAHAAEIQAIQKLKDLAGYVEIYADASMDPVFRQKAGEMIKGLFISDKSRLSVGKFKNGKIKCLPLDEFLKEGFGDGINSARIIFDSLYILNPLEKSGVETYAGQITGYQSVTAFCANDTIIQPLRPVIIDIVSSMQSKIIGKDTLVVRVVSLGDMQVK